MLKGRSLQYAASISVSILAATTYIALMWTIPILPLFINDDDTPLEEKITLTQMALITFLLLFGSIVGNIIYGILLDVIGRRKTLLLAAIPTCISWLIILFLPTIEAVLVARFIMGFSASGPIAMAMVYITEISESQIRGKLSFFCLLFAELGALIAVVLGSINYQLVALVASIVPIIYFLIFYFMPESPYFYLLKEKSNKAEMVLTQLRDENVNVEAELEEIKKIVDQNLKDKETIKDLFLNRKYRKALLIILVLKFVQELSGGHALQSNIGLLFKIANTGLDVNTSSIICIVVPFPFLLATSYLIDKYGRKPLYYISALGSAFSLILEAIFFYIQESGADVSSINWLPVTGILLQVIFKAGGILGIPFLLTGELFPPSIKAVASAVIMIFSGILGSLVALIFPYFVVLTGLATSFIIFAIFCIGGFLFMYYFVPETKGKTLAELQNY